MASDPQSSAGNFSPISRMAGMDQGQGGPTGPSGGQLPAGGDPQAALASATESVRQVESTIEALSAQFPQVAPEARRAREAVRALLMRIVANPGGAEPAAPSGPLG